MKAIVDLNVKLFNAATEFDRRASKRAGYNPHALGHYARALGLIRRAVAAGRPIREAIVVTTLDRFRDCLLKAIGEPFAERHEHYPATLRVIESFDDETEGGQS